MVEQLPRQRSAVRAVPNKSVVTVRLLSGFRLRCSKTLRWSLDCGLVCRADISGRFCGAGFRRGMPLWISLSTFIRGIAERIGETFGGPLNTSNDPVNEFTKLRF